MKQNLYKGDKMKTKLSISSYSKFRIEQETKFCGTQVIELDIEKMTKAEKHGFMRWMLDAMDKLTRSYK